MQEHFIFRCLIQFYPLDAVKEFQVVATGASAEFGRTAGGVINIITKAGTNEVHGSLFHFQRLEALTANGSVRAVQYLQQSQQYQPAEHAGPL